MRLENQRVAKPVKTTISEPYTQEKVVINKNTIKKFIRPKWHRDFREAHINHIRRSLMNAVHFSEALTVNCAKDEYRVINGNYRIEAIRRVIKEFPDFSIGVRLTKYTDLEKTRELHIYNIVNNTKPESLLDRVKAHCIDSYFVKEVMKEFPIKVLFRYANKKDPNAMPITTLVMPYIQRNSKGFNCPTLKLIDEINEFGPVDILRIRSYMKFFLNCFGSFCKENMYANYNLFSTLGKIYFNNIDTTVTIAELQKRIEKLKLKNTADLSHFSRGGFDTRDRLYDFLLRKLTGRTPLFDIVSAKNMENY